MMFGLVDAYRQAHPEGADLTWYGPQGGQRLDHFFISPAVFARVQGVGYEHDVRVKKIGDSESHRLARNTRTGHAR